LRTYRSIPSKPCNERQHGPGAGGTGRVQSPPELGRVLPERPARLGTEPGALGAAHMGQSVAFTSQSRRV